MLATQAQPLPCQNPNSERHNSTPYGGVTNPYYAIDASATTYSKLHTLSGTIYQDLKFPSGALAGDTIKIKLSFAVPILYPAMIGNVQVGSYKGTTPNNDYKSLTSPSVILQWSSSTEVLVSFAPSVNFDWAEVRITALESYQVSEVRIHYAYKPSVPPAVTPSSITICPGQRATLSVTGQPGSVFKWYTQPTGGIGIRTGTTYTTPPLYASKTYYVTAELHGCPSKRTAVTVTVSPNGISKIWDNTYGGSRQDYIRSLLYTSDGGYLLGATTASVDGDVPDSTHISFDFWAIKTDSNGNIQWDYIYKQPQLSELVEMAHTPDGGYILAGYNIFDGPPITNRGNEDLYLVKIDASGNKVWDTIYGGPDYEETTSIIPATGGGYIITAFTSSNSGDITDGTNGAEDFWVLKIDENGNKLWDKTYGGSSTDYPFDVISTGDGNYFVVGYTQSNNGDVTDTTYGDADIWIVKFDGSGNKLADYTFGAAGADVAFKMYRNLDNTYMLCGQTTSQGGDFIDTNNGYYDGFLLKMNYAGNELWGKAYGGSMFDEFTTLNPAPNKGFILGGNSQSSDGDVTDGNNGGEDVWIVRVDSLGSLLTDKTFGSSSFEYIPASLALPGGNYLFAGQSSGSNGDITDGNNGSTDALLLKVRLGCDEDHLAAKVSSTTEASSTEDKVTFYPNPFSSVLNISMDQTTAGIVKVELLNLAGGKVGIFNATAPQITLPTENLEPGIYICKIYAGEQIFVRKVIKFE